MSLAAMSAIDRSDGSAPHHEDIEAVLASLEQRLAAARVLGEEKAIIDEVEQIVAEIRAALSGRGSGTSSPPDKGPTGA